MLWCTMGGDGVILWAEGAGLWVGFPQGFHARVLFPYVALHAWCVVEHVHMCAYGGQKTTLHVIISSFLSFFETGFVTETRACQAGEAAGQQSPSHRPALTCVSPCPAFSLRFWGLNLGLHDCSKHLTG